MAKKKVTSHQDKQRQQQEVKEESKGRGMEGAASEKVESLKNLNSMLLKETVEKRQQVDSLALAKARLESLLKTSHTEKHELQAQLTRSTEHLAQLEIENKLVCVFAAAESNAFIDKKLKSLERQLSDALREKAEIDKVRIEKETEVESLRKKLNDIGDEIALERSVKDEMKANLDAQIEEANGLRVKLDKAEKQTEVETGKLRAEYSALVDKIKERESKVQSLESVLSDSNRVIEDLSGQIDGIVREKQGIEAERDAQVSKSSELQNTVTALNDKVLRLQREDVKLRENLADLEDKCLRKEEEIEKKINELVTQRDIRDKSLIEEKGFVDKELNKVLEQLDEERKMIERTVSEKNEMEEAKLRREAEIVELQKQLAEFKYALSEMELSRISQGEKMKNLESEIDHSKAAFERVALEKDEITKCFDREKRDGMNMKKQIEELEKHIHEIGKEVEQTKADYLNVVKEKKDLEGRCVVLNQEIAHVKASLGEAHKEVSSLQSKVELAESSRDEILNAVKAAADSICCSNGSVRQMNGEDVKPYEAELEAIKKVIMSKEKKVEEMKREVELLQFSVAQAQKKKNFWTMLSSATTLFAAISLAYVARAGQ